MENDFPIKPIVLSAYDIRSTGEVIPGIKLSCHAKNENTFSVCILNSWIEISDSKGIRWAKGPLFHTLNSSIKPAVINAAKEGLAEIYFQLPIPILRKIEEYRKGDDIELAIHSRVIVSKVIDGPQGYMIGVPFETRFVSKNSDQFKYDMPKSKWINLYNSFGLNKIELIEIDFNIEGEKNPVFKRALDRLNEAKRAFLQNDYETVLLNCRKLQEAFIQDSNQKEGLEHANLAIEKFVSDAKKAEKIDGIIKNIGQFLHLGRHESHPPVVITRKDAEFAIQINSALLSYLMRYNT